MISNNMPDLSSGNCVGLDTDLFYDDMTIVEREEEYWSDVNQKHYVKYVESSTEQRRWLRQICLTCPVLQDCREYAISHETWGFWGGLTATERESERVIRGIKVDEPRDYYMVKEIMGIKRGVDNGRRDDER